MQLDAIILAAGRGSRMKSTDTNKCLLPLAGTPMIRYTINTLKKLGISKPLIVVGFAKESIKKELRREVRYAFQKTPNGTAKAVASGLAHINKSDTVIVLYGDHSAFYDVVILKNLLAKHKKTNADATLITVKMKNPSGYGRIVRDSFGKFVEIVEEKNASDKEKHISEINTGNGVYKLSFLQKVLPLVRANKLTNEYYFTDVVKLGVKNKNIIETFTSDKEELSIGVNTREQYKFAEDLMQSKLKN